MQTKQDKPNADTEVFCAEIGLMLSLQLVGTLGCDVFALGAQFRVAARVVHFLHVIFQTHNIFRVMHVYEPCSGCWGSP